MVQCIVHHRTMENTMFITVYKVLRLYVTVAGNIEKYKLNSITTHKYYIIMVLILGIYVWCLTNYLLY